MPLHPLPTAIAPPLLPIDTARKLHIGHFAFMRALIQGADSKAAWERYLQIEGAHSDARIVRKTIQWIRDAFAAAAKREHKFGTARLVLADWSQIGARKQHQPTLDQFVADQGLEGFSEAEQIVAFLEAYPAVAVQQKRRAKLIAQQLDALRWLEELAAQPPGARDPIASWISPDLARHLQAAGLFTLRQLVTHINGIGKRWYGAIPAVGPLKAKRIEDWLRAHEGSIGLALGRHITGPPEKALPARAGAGGAASNGDRPDRQTDRARRTGRQPGLVPCATRAMHDAGKQ